MATARIFAVLAISCFALSGWAAAEAPAVGSTVTGQRISPAPAEAAIVQPVGNPIVTTAEGESVALTVYNDGNAIVKEIRSITVPKGASEVRFEDVAKTIDPTSVTFRSVTDPDGTTVLEQNYEYDLVSADKILEKYLGKRVDIITQSGTAYTGTLLSFDPGQVVVGGDQGGGLSIVARQENVKSITAESLPEGLIIKPTLMWLLKSAAGGDQKIEVAYSASQCSWKADYSAILNQNDKTMDFSGWVTLTNSSGKSYKDAALKLIAGEVHRAEQPQVMRARGGWPWRRRPPRRSSRRRPLPSTTYTRCRGRRPSRITRSSRSSSSRVGRSRREEVPLRPHEGLPPLVAGADD